MNERKPNGHWTDEMILEDLKKLKAELGHFPKDTEIRALRRFGLHNAIRKHGGINYFRELLGEEPPYVPDGFWTEETILDELKKLKAELGHFPKDTEIRVVGRRGLATAISKHGGINYFRELLGEEILKASDGFWNDETILDELKKLKAELSHFPTKKELETMKRTDLSNAISKHGSMNKFRKLLGDEPLQVDTGFWTEENILEDLKKLKAELGHFPTHSELAALGRGNLQNSISRNGGYNKYRELFGEEILKVSDGFWTEENILEDLKKLKAELGHFPTQQELIRKERHDLVNAIMKQGGSNYFRELLGVELLQNPAGFWTEEKTFEELKKILSEIGHFPTQMELWASGRSSLGAAINKYGGVDYFRKLLGYPTSLEELAGMHSYINHRGNKSEKEVKKILVQYCIKKGIPEPRYNVKLSAGNILEFVFEAGCGERIGIDVVNTQGGWQIRRKYLVKDYHKHLDKLWIVVLSDIFTDEDYIEFNEESPDNVEIMSVWDLINTLQVDIDEHSKRKLEALETCTLRTKNDLINTLKNRTLGEYI